jgi:hypothetical protein
MPDLADFARLHPDIEAEILPSGELTNLTNREADVAIRVVYDRKTLPLKLHGLKGPELFGGVYMSRDRLAAWRAGAPDPIRWIVISAHGIPDWAREGEVRPTAVPFRTTDCETQIVAVRQGLGMTTLPCFVGDADPLLARVPGTGLHMHGTLWLLTQGRHARRSACGSLPSSYPAGSPRTRRFSRDCQYRATDARQVTGRRGACVDPGRAERHLHRPVAQVKAKHIHQIVLLHTGSGGRTRCGSAAAPARQQARHHAQGERRQDQFDHVRPSSKSKLLSGQADSVGLRHRRCPLVGSCGQVSMQRKLTSD